MSPIRSKQPPLLCTGRESLTHPGAGPWPSSAPLLAEGSGVLAEDHEGALTMWFTLRCGAPAKGWNTRASAAGRPSTCQKSTPKVCEGDLSLPKFCVAVRLRDSDYLAMVYRTAAILSLNCSVIAALTTLSPLQFKPSSII